MSDASESFLNTPGDTGATFTGYMALFVVIAFFAGLFPLVSDSLSILDFNHLIGRFGIIGQQDAPGCATFIGRGGTAVRHGFLFSISVIPAVMFALGVVNAADTFGALRAAQRLLTPLMRPLLGLPGGAALALITSTQSSDAGAALTRRIYDEGIINDRERAIFSAFQFSSASCVTVYLSSAPAFSQGLTIPFLAPVGVLLVFKVFGANLMRLWLAITESGSSAQTTADTAVAPNVCTAPPASPDLPSSRIMADTTGTAHRGKKPSAYSACIDGMRQGWKLGVGSLLPNIMLAFALIAILQQTGLLTLISSAFKPVMSLFGLPGEAVSVLAASWLSGLAGAGVAASLFAQGLLSPQELTILVPGLYLLGAQIQYMGRILAVAGTSPRTYPALFIISLVNSACAMLFMRFFVVN